MPNGIPLPTPWWKRALVSTTTYDALIAFLTLPVAVLGAKKFHDDGYGLWVYLVPLGVFVATAVKVVLSERKERAEARIHALEGALHTLRRLVLDADQVPPDVDPKLRLTVHIPDGSRKELVQLLDYVGDQRKKSTAGRRTPENCGVIGAALMSKEMARGKRETPDREAYVGELIGRWHFREDSARQLDASTMAWLAIPLKSGKNEVVAVLYLDTIQPEFFTEMRVLVALSGAAGIAEFVQRRYY